jgi:hypothetical protein
MLASTMPYGVAPFPKPSGREAAMNFMSFQL